MEKVYLETSFVSYLVARLSGDLLVAANQKVTRDWWDQYRNDFELFTSQAVISESSAGDPTECQKRLAILQNIGILTLTAPAMELSRAIMERGILPPKVVADSLHIAIAIVQGMDYLLTWNCRHLANAKIARRIARICKDFGYEMPALCTPPELMGD
jgi:hypothetical protein